MDQFQYGQGQASRHPHESMLGAPAMNAPVDIAKMLQPRPVPAAMLDALKARFGERCSTAQAVRDQHGRDESPFEVPPPEAVVFAESTADVAACDRRSRARKRASSSGSSNGLIM